MATRTLNQNSLLWAIYEEILAKGGAAVRGFGKDDLHEFFLIEHFGGEVNALFGRKRLRPRRRSSALSKMEFSEHVEFILHFMAEHGVVIETMEAA